MNIFHLLPISVSVVATGQAGSSYLVSIHLSFRLEFELNTVLNMHFCTKREIAYYLIE